MLIIPMHDNTKLTAVTITYRGKKHTFWCHLEHKPDGGAILPRDVLQRLVAQVGVEYNDCYTIG